MVAMEPSASAPCAVIVSGPGDTTTVPFVGAVIDTVGARFEYTVTGVETAIAPRLSVARAVMA